MTYVDITEEPQRIISFCTGIRGLERGLERINPNIRTVIYVEVEAFIIENLVAQMEKGLLAPAPVWADARTFQAHRFRNKIDGIIGGYPCQGESIAGLRELENYPGFLWPAIRNAVKAIKPVWCYFENVDDHLSGTFRYVLNDLRELGYTVEVGIYTAEEVGAPHERQRVFIFAVENTVRLRMRRWNGEGTNGGFEVQTSGSGDMANAIGDPGRLSDSEGWKPEAQTSWRSETMVNTGGIGSESEHAISAGRNGIEFTGKGKLANAPGIGESESGQQHKTAIINADGLSGENELANTTGTRLEKSDRSESGQSSKDGEGTELADTDINASGLGRSDVRRKGKKTKGKKHRKKRNEEIGERGGSIVGNIGEDVANGTRIGREGRKRLETGSIAETDGTFPGSRIDGNDSAIGTERYPARPGENQHAWEEPRTIKSGMGCTAHGYKFREDFLRAIGNSVMEDVTIVSFIDLYLKHMHNASRIPE